MFFVSPEVGWGSFKRIWLLVVKADFGLKDSNSAPSSDPGGEFVRFFRCSRSIAWMKGIDYQI
jgi:hypothetical protein